MITIYWNGWSIDPGTKFVTGGDKYLLEMAGELGLQEQLYQMFTDSDRIAQTQKAARPFCVSNHR